MRVPLSWLQSYTPIDVKAGDGPAVAELASVLDSLGLVVEGVERVGEGLGEVVLAEVLEIGPIQGADRIRRVVVDRGDALTTEVVCGAWNFVAGDVVPLAPVGSELPGGFKIERRKMKGVVSNGMICSARELGLGQDHEGILVLGHSGDGRAAQALGQTIGDYLGLGLDVVFDLAVEPNRPDCLSIVGVARDLAAYHRLPLEVPEPVVPEAGPPSSELASVEVLSPELCFRFTGRVLSGVTFVASPMLVQRRLTLAGMRPIDALVDASNYAMLELGQPTHAYDLDRLGGAGLRVRSARKGESIVTLDGVSRQLGTRPPRAGDPLSGLDCVIADGNDVPVGVGGVMGGEASEVGPETGRVLIEAAWFLGVGVGRTSRHLGLRSEASMRFERGIDPLGIVRSSARVCELILAAAEAAGVAPPLVHEGLLDANPVRYSEVVVPVRPGRVNALLGTTLAPTDMTLLLEPIGYSFPKEETEPVLSAHVPSFRPDVRTEVDVIEDVARAFGYGNVPRSDRRSPYVGRLEPVQAMRRRLRRVLCGLGADEAWTSSIVDPAMQVRAGWSERLLSLSNPMVGEESALRPGLLAGLLTAVRFNAGHRNPNVRLFEIGDVFGAAEDALHSEAERVALVLADAEDSAAEAVSSWRVIEDAFGLAGVEIVQGEAAGPAAPGLHAARYGVLRYEGERGTIDLGVLGEVDPEVVAGFGLAHRRIGWLELGVTELLEAPHRPSQAVPVSRYPSSDVDLALIVSDSVPAANVEKVLRSAGSGLCESVELFDVYRGQGVDAGHRSLAFRLRFRAPDRTLTDAELSGLWSACVEAAEAGTGAVLRG